MIKFLGTVTYSHKLQLLPRACIWDTSVSMSSLPSNTLWRKSEGYFLVEFLAVLSNSLDKRAAGNTQQSDYYGQKAPRDQIIQSYCSEAKHRREKKKTAYRRPLISLTCADSSTNVKTRRAAPAIPGLLKT